MFGDMWRSPTSPYAELEWMRSLFDDLLEPAGTADIRSVPRGSYPLVNIGATDDAVTVYVFAPGVDPASLQVDVEGTLLTVSGRREAPESGDAGTWYRRERFTGEFRRAIALPDGLDPELAEARMRNGVLELKLPKRAEMQRRRIQVRAA